MIRNLLILTLLPLLSYGQFTQKLKHGGIIKGQKKKNGSLLKILIKNSKRQLNLLLSMEHLMAITVYQIETYLKLVLDN